MSVLYVPPCPTTCSGYLAEVDFDECAPTYHWGEVAKIYLAESSFTGFFGDETEFLDPAAWAAFIAAGSIRELIVIGELPEPEITQVETSGDRIAIGYRTFNLNFEIDETNHTNYAFMLMTECGGKYLMWYETADGLLYGGVDGIEVSLKMYHSIPRARTELAKIYGTATWKSLQSPFRDESPIT